MAAQDSCIAIDGPVAVGKTTVGRLLAARLDYKFIDTGNMYRALTYKALKLGVDPKDGPALSRLAENTTLELVPAQGHESSLVVDGQDVSGSLRSPRVERAVSTVSSFPEVRRALVRHQRRMADKGRVVMAGRDIGTIVLPGARLKIFLEASPQERARRRYQEQNAKASGKGLSYEAILSELERRDRLDSQRAVSPLRPAADAEIVDTQGLTPEEVVDRICRLMSTA